MGQDIRVEAGTKVDLKDYDPDFTGKFKNEEDTLDELNKLKDRLFDLQRLMYADNRYSLLIVIQAMDAGGKDGLIRSVMSIFNPQGCTVVPFKVPSEEERDHDYLWRIHKSLPRKGEICIFNRSHYEDVLVVRVHNLVPREVWKARYSQINDFERYLAENNVVIRKFYLHISKKEQEERMMKRLLDPKKNWKFSTGDLKERDHWDEYMEAYEDALSKCSTKEAPWYIVPSDKKWYRNLSVARVLVETLEALPMKWPEPVAEVKEIARRAQATGRLPEIK
ncbi:MAG: polyphosphate kinase 2 family protein [Euryarchaeota archaeon]|nr:polyphosphate kinase 2 family protein [Euryarchaeota archaeon]